MSSTTDEIHFIWMSPEKPYGEIVNYTLEIEVTITCIVLNYFS